MGQTGVAWQGVGPVPRVVMLELSGCAETETDTPFAADVACSCPQGKNNQRGQDGTRRNGKKGHCSILH